MVPEPRLPSRVENLGIRDRYPYQQSEQLMEQILGWNCMADPEVGKKDLKTRTTVHTGLTILKILLLQETKEVISDVPVSSVLEVDERLVITDPGHSPQ